MMTKLKITRDAARKIVEAGTETTRNGRQRLKKGTVGKTLNKLSKTFVNVLLSPITKTSGAFLRYVSNPQTSAQFDAVLLKINGSSLIKLTEGQSNETFYGPEIVTDVSLTNGVLSVTKQRIRVYTGADAPNAAVSDSSMRLYVKSYDALTSVSAGSTQVLRDVE